MTSVEVLAARDLVRSLPEGVYGARYAEVWLSTVGDDLKAREAVEAAAIAAEEKAKQEAAALAAYGGVAAAEAGWNALRQHNPKVDRSTGDRDINSFDELPHALKLNYAAFAFGVLNPGAKLGSAVPVEAYQFKVGDKVRITGPVTSHRAGRPSFESGQVVVVTGPLDENGDLETKGDFWGSPLRQWIDPASLTLVREPREWDSVEEIPVGVKFTNASNVESDYWVKESDTACRWHSGGYRRAEWLAGTVDGYAPFVEVIA